MRRQQGNKATRQQGNEATRQQGNKATRQRIGEPAFGRFGAGLVAAVLIALSTSIAEAGGASVRLWPTAVVVDDDILLPDLCRLQGFDAATERKLAELIIDAAPPPGGSRIIHLDGIRALLAANGINMAQVTFSGAGQCAVTRPAQIGRHENESGTSSAAMRSKPNGGADGTIRNSARDIGESMKQPESTERETTLRQFILDYFNNELSRYGGRADVVFDRGSQAMLDLNGPDYQFRIRRRTGSPLGLVSFEADVVSRGTVVQTVPIAAQVAMIRPVVIARRPINQGAAIEALDVEVRAMSFTRLQNLGVTDRNRVIGQRAKRFVAAGNIVDPELLESMPVVARGQLVKLTSVSGAVQVVTTATAMAAGRVGEVITVRAGGDSRTEMDAVVIGPGAVRVGGPEPTAEPGPERWMAAATRSGS